jgi:hypothetical protein
LNTRGVQQFLVSGEKKLEVLAVSYSTGLIDLNSKLLKIKGDNIEELRLQIKNYFRLLYQNFAKKDL